jgi:hypothetical protein
VCAHVPVAAIHQLPPVACFDPVRHTCTTKFWIPLVPR